MCIFAKHSSLLVLHYTCAWDAGTLGCHSLCHQPAHSPHGVTSHPIPFLPAVSSVGFCSPGPPANCLGGLLCAPPSDPNSTLSTCCAFAWWSASFSSRSLYLLVLSELGPLSLLLPPGRWHLLAHPRMGPLLLVAPRLSLLFDSLSF